MHIIIGTADIIIDTTYHWDSNDDSSFPTIVDTVCLGATMMTVCIIIIDTESPIRPVQYEFELLLSIMFVSVRLNQRRWWYLLRMTIIDQNPKLVKIITIEIGAFFAHYQRWYWLLIICDWSRINYNPYDTNLIRRIHKTMIIIHSCSLSRITSMPFLSMAITHAIWVILFFLLLLLQPFLQDESESTPLYY